MILYCLLGLLFSVPQLAAAADPAPFLSEKTEIEGESLVPHLLQTKLLKIVESIVRRIPPKNSPPGADVSTSYTSQDGSLSSSNAERKSVLADLEQLAHSAQAMHNPLVFQHAYLMQASYLRTSLLASSTETLFLQRLEKYFPYLAYANVIDTEEKTPTQQQTLVLRHSYKGVEYAASLMKHLLMHLLNDKEIENSIQELRKPSDMFLQYLWSMVYYYQEWIASFTSERNAQEGGRFFSFASVKWLVKLQSDGSGAPHSYFKRLSPHQKKAAMLFWLTYALFFVDTIPGAQVTASAATPTTSIVSFSPDIYLYWEAVLIGFEYFAESAQVSSCIADYRFMLCDAIEQHVGDTTRCSCTIL